MKRGFQHFVSGIHFGALIEQIFGELGVAFFDSVVQTSLVGVVDLSQNLVLVVLELSQVLDYTAGITLFAQIEKGGDFSKSLRVNARFCLPLKVEVTFL